MAITYEEHERLCQTINTLNLHDKQLQVHKLTVYQPSKKPDIKPVPAQKSLTRKFENSMIKLSNGKEHTIAFTKSPL